jgi:hypothetical protein
MSKARELADVIGTQSTTENVLQGRRNLIINGDFQVWQRGTTLTTGADHFLADRWNTTPPATVSTTTSQVFDSTLQQNMVKMELNAAGGIQFQHKIENFKWAHNKKLTFSFYAKSNVSHTMQVFLRLRNSSVNDLLDQDSVSLTSTLTKFVMTFDASDLSGYTEDSSSAIQLSFSSAGLSSGDYIQLGQAQLEVGSVATPFEHRSYGEELALCQRYYQNALDTFAVSCDINDASFPSVQFPVTMRAAPSVTVYSAAGSTANRMSRYGGTKCTVSGVQTSTTGIALIQHDSESSTFSSGIWGFRWIAEAEL